MSRISCVIVMCPLLLANALAFRDDLLSAFTDRDSPARPKRILNGEAVRMNREIKYQVLIRGKPKGKFVCGGSIIGEQSVLTAAHCLVNNENETFMELPPVILAGITNARAKQHGHYFKSDVIKAYIPKDFKWQDQETASIADIAVLKLQHNFGRRYYLSKINLPAVNMTKSYDGIRALVTGYGYDDIECNAGDEDANCKWSWSGQLNKMIVRIITSEESDSLLDYCKPREKFICAVIDPRYESGGPCSGDSGGPLVFNNTVIGVMINSPEWCDQVRVPGRYTRVATYIDFIRNAMNDVATLDMRVHSWTTRG